LYSQKEGEEGEEMKIKSVELVRDFKLDEYITEFNFKNFDNPEYKYVFCSGYIPESKIKYDSWSSDGFKIVYNNLCAGVITFSIDRTIYSCYDWEIKLEPQYLNSGIGALALCKILEYAFRERGFNKINMCVCANNTRAKKLYEKCSFVRRIGIYYNHFLLRDGTYENKITYEISKEDYLEKYKDNITSRFPQ